MLRARWNAHSLERSCARAVSAGGLCHQHEAGSTQARTPARAAAAGPASGSLARLRGRHLLRRQVRLLRAVAGGRAARRLPGQHAAQRPARAGGLRSGAGPRLCAATYPAEYPPPVPLSGAPFIFCHQRQQLPASRRRTRTSRCRHPRVVRAAPAFSPGNNQPAAAGRPARAPLSGSVQATRPLLSIQRPRAVHRLSPGAPGGHVRRLTAGACQPWHLPGSAGDGAVHVQPNMLPQTSGGWKGPAHRVRAASVAPGRAGPTLHQRDFLAVGHSRAARWRARCSPSQAAARGRAPVWRAAVARTGRGRRRMVVCRRPLPGRVHGGSACSPAPHVPQLSHPVSPRGLPPARWRILRQPRLHAGRLLARPGRPAAAAGRRRQSKGGRQMGRPGPSEQDARAVAGGNAPWGRTPLLSDGLPGLPAPPWVGLGLLGEVANKPCPPAACPAFLLNAGLLTKFSQEPAERSGSKSSNL